MGHFGDVAPVGEGVSEMHIFYGPGYRAYFVRRGPVVVILLSGGDKSTQAADIIRAKDLARQIEEWLTMMTTKRWDSAEHLKTEEDIRLYMEACLEEAGDNPAFIIQALGVVARARNMSQLVPR